METSTMSTETAKPWTIDDLIDAAEPAVPAGGVPEITPIARASAEAAAKTAYHAARAKGASVDHAKAAAQIAYEGSVETSITEAAKVLLGAQVQTATAELVPSDAVQGGTMDEAGRARSERDAAAARAAGFAVAETVYERGTRVIDLGADNARRSRIAHDGKPLVTENCDAIIAKIAAEDRRLHAVEKRSVAMTDTGAVGAIEHGAPQLAAPYLPVTLGAFSSLCSRLGYGGAAYLQKCEPELRARNVNTWRERIAAEEVQRRAAVKPGEEDPGASRLVLRSRNGKGGREYFAAVSPGYAPFDVDKIAQAIKIAVPAEARGACKYDGERARFEAMFQTTVQPRHFVAGEFFRAGVIVRSDDTGAGAVRVTSVAWQNLCLNLIIVDKMAQDVASIRHVGDPFALAQKFKAAFAKALGKLDHFLVRWGYACEEDVLARSRLIAADVPTKTDAALPGIFNGILDAGLVKLRGDRHELVDQLCAKWEADESGAKQVHAVSRAAIVNAFTRWAHEAELDDPWAEDEIQRQASALLWGARDLEPKPLPYMPIDQLDEILAAAQAAEAR